VSSEESGVEDFQVRSVQEDWAKEGQVVNNFQWKEKEITMAYGKSMSKSKKAPMFKPCKGCPTPAKCKKAKRCMKKAKK